MNGLYRIGSVFWAPARSLQEASLEPAILLPLAVPTAFASLTSLIVYFTLDPADPSLAILWLIGLVSAAIGPVVIVLLVSSFFFALFSVLGRRVGYRAFLSVTAFAFVPTALHHLAQGVLLLPISQPMSTPQFGRLNLALFLDSQSVSSGVFVAAGMIDVISLWVLALLVVGYRYVARPTLAPGARVTAVVLTWSIYVGIRIALADTLAF